MENKTLDDVLVKRVAEDLDTLINQYIDNVYDPINIRGMVDKEFKEDVLHNVIAEVKKEMLL